MPDSLVSLVRRMNRPKILVAGDLMLDRYVDGSVGRISPEAPIPVLKTESDTQRLGGAGSVVQNLSVLGADVTCCGVVGCDAEGDTFKAELDRLSISSEGLIRTKDRPTTLKTRFVSRHQQVLRVDREETSDLPDQLQQRICSFAEAAVPRQDAVIIQDYSKGLATGFVCERIIKAGREHSVPVLVDPGRGADYSKYRGAGCLKPNRHEAGEATGLSLDDEVTIREAASKLVDQLGLDAVVMTLDADGMFLGEANGRTLLVPTDALDVFDVTGAGDMIISVLAAVTASGGSYHEAVRVANAAASVEITKLGVQPVTTGEIIGRLNQNSYGYAGKIVDEQALRRTVDELRKEGKKIVFTNGCFDLLHVGHVRLLHDARKLGDVLIVGLNTDASVRRQKGPDRPILPEHERSHLLAAIADVDYVTLFDEDTPLHLIADVVRPDVLVKGSDYENRLVVGREEVEARGGRVELISIVPGMSTSNIVSRILEGGN